MWLRTSHLIPLMTRKWSCRLGDTPIQCYIFTILLIKVCWLICRAEVWRGPTSNIESSVEEGTIGATNRDSHNFAINILTLVEICPRLNISQNRMISLALGKKLLPRVWQQALWWRLHLPTSLSSCNAQIASSTGRKMLAVMALPTPRSLPGRISRTKATLNRKW